MQDAPGVIEVSIPSDRWDDQVEFHTQLFGDPQERSDSAALFRSEEDNLTLRLTRVETKELIDANQRLFYAWGGSNGSQSLDTLFKRFERSGRNPRVIQKPITVDPQDGGTTIAIIRTDKGSGKLVDLNFYCLVHNPNW